MITLEEAKKRGILAQFSEPDPDFVISAKSDKEVRHNIMQMLKIRDLLNENLSISNYSSALKNLTFIYLIMPPNNDGVNWKERKYYKRSEQKYFIDICFSDYDRFCKAKPQEALKLMATETLRGAKKFLSGVKDFNFERFYADVEDLFKEQGWV